MQINFFKKNTQKEHEIVNEVVMKEYPRLLTVQSFMVGGLVSYEDTGDGVFLLKKETLDKMMPTIEGRPVVLGHQPITLENLEDKAVGYVTKGWFNPETGQFDCEVLIKDSDVYESIKNGNNKVSSAYQVTELGDGGKYLGQDYEAEILDGTFTHLAIVDNPRYPDAKILINSLYGDKEMGLFNKNTKIEKITASDTAIEYEGNVYSISELVNAYNLCNEAEEEKEEEKKEEVEEKVEEKKNQGNCKRNEDEDEKENEDSDDELVEKVKKIVAEMLEKHDEEEEKKNKRNEDKEDKDNEEEEEKEEEKKENRNALRLKNSYNSPRPVTYGVTTRVERIKNSNAKYSI